MVLIKGNKITKKLVVINITLFALFFNIYASPVRVKVLKLNPQQISRQINAVGRLYPNKSVEIKAQLSGIVEKVYVNSGNQVKQDEHLVKLNSIDYELEHESINIKLKTAQIKLASVESKYKRAEKLIVTDAISKEDFESIQYEYNMNKNEVDFINVELKKANYTLNKATIKAPFSGQIALLNVEVGQYVNAGTALITLIDLSSVRARIQVVENDYVHIRKQDSAIILIESYPGMNLKGKVDKIGIMADSKSSTFPIEVKILNMNLDLKAGFSTRITINSKNIGDVFLIPEDAILYKQNSKSVFVTNTDKKAIVRAVKTGERTDGKIQILSGLKKSDLLIIKGQNELKNGDKIEIVNQD